MSLFSKIKSYFYPLLGNKGSVPVEVKMTTTVSPLDVAADVFCPVCCVHWHQWQLLPMQAELRPLSANAQSITEKRSEETFTVYVCPECGNAEFGA